MTDETWKWLGTLLLTLVSGGGVVGWWKTIKDDRRAERAEPVDLVARTFETQMAMSSHLTEMQRRITELVADNIANREEASAAKVASQEALRRAAHAEAQTSRLREALLWITGQIRPLIEWVDSGAKPPPPAIPEDLRAYLAGELDTSARHRLEDL